MLRAAAALFVCALLLLLLVWLLWTPPQAPPPRLCGPSRTGRRSSLPRRLVLVLQGGVASHQFWVVVAEQTLTPRSQTVPVGHSVSTWLSVAPRVRQSLLHFTASWTRLRLSGEPQVLRLPICVGPHLYVGLPNSVKRRRKSFSELLLVLPLLGAVGKYSVPPPDTVPGTKAWSVGMSRFA